MLEWCHKIHIYLLDYTKRLPAPTPQGRVEQIGGHPDGVKAIGGAGEPKNRGGLEFISISPQRAQRPQRILLHWLCVLSVLCGAVFHK